MDAEQKIEELRYMGQIIMRWPRLGACSASVSQILISGINQQIARWEQIKEQRNDEATG